MNCHQKEGSGTAGESLPESGKPGSSDSGSPSFLKGPLLSRENGRYNLRPLRGGRRGAPGASAGCRSRMRTIGDEKLNRRALAGDEPEQVTAESSSPPSSPRSLFSYENGSSRHSFSRQTSPISAPSSPSITSRTDVVQEAVANIPTPTVARTRTRIRWTDNMNRSIWRAYLTASQLDQNTRSYLSEMHRIFTNQFPEIKVSRQRIGDQKRAILRNKLLPQNVLDEIRAEVTSMFNCHHETLVNHTLEETQIPQPNSQPSTQNSHTLDISRQRMSWSNDINETILRTYYKITQLETNRTAYRPALHAAVITAHPHLLHVSEQRISDQLRAIIKNKYLTDTRIQEIRDQVAIEIEPDTEAHTHSQPSQSHTQIPFSPPSPSNTHHETSNLAAESIGEENHNNNNHHMQHNNIAILPEERIEEVEELFIKTLADFKDVNPTLRPFIPKQKPNRQFAILIHTINVKILPKHIGTETDFTTLQTIIYCAAHTAVTYSGSKIHDLNEAQRPHIKKRTPTWQIRLEKRIANLRADISRLTHNLQGNTSFRLLQHVERIKIQYRVHSQYEPDNTDLSHFIDTLKQKLNALASRLRRYKLTTLRKTQNKMFCTNEKQFYRTLLRKSSNNTTETPTETPTPESLHNFWSNIWSNPITHNNNNSWIPEDQQVHQSTPAMEFDSVTIDTLTSVIAKTHNWKATGSDKIHNYWFKKLTNTHPLLLKHINEFIRNPDHMPLYITQGTTYMLPKDLTDTKNPAKYRPITCLQNIYKIITSCISQLIYKHVNTNQLLAEQQKGCRKFSQGCKEQLIIDSVACKQALRKKRNIYSMFIDYKKAFDSVPHTWLIFVLQHYKVHPILISYLSITMQNWNTILKLYRDNETIQTDNIAIRRGIFQGDSLSPLWFCLALNPLSNLLNNTDKGFRIKFDNTEHTLSHLLYMDDIKLYGSNLTEIHALADITQKFSNDIHMEFGIDKCKIQSVHRGNVENNTYTLDNGEEIVAVDDEIGYKYLGYYQTQQIHQKDTKATITQKFRDRINYILKTQLNARNTIKAINTYAIPILTYSFGIINWSQSDLIKHQRIINTSMTKQRKHHPRSCTQRLTLPKIEGGRGIIHIKNLHNKQITTLRSFFHSRAPESTLHNAVVQADTKLTPLNLQDNQPQKNESIIKPQQKIAIWTQKSLHGRHRLDLTNPNVDKIASNMWLKRGELFPETEGFMLAIQDQVIDTRNYRKHIIHDHTLVTDRCRHCHGASETIQHITGACKSLAQSDYKHRHDQVAAIIHQHLAFKYKLITEKTAYYKYKPQTVLESTEFKLYWDRTIITDKTVHFNRPDLTLLDKNNKTVYLIDIAIPNTHNLTSTHTEKITKYTDLAIEIKTQWHVQSVKTVPIIISSTGVIPLTLHTSLKSLDIPRPTFILLQKATILNTCRIVRKFMGKDHELQSY